MVQTNYMRRDVASGCDDDPMKCAFINVVVGVIILSHILHETLGEATVLLLASVHDNYERGDLLLLYSSLLYSPFKHDK